MMIGWRAWLPPELKELVLVNDWRQQQNASAVGYLRTFFVLEQPMVSHQNN